ncbi:hypothetical protein ACRCPS_18310 [Pseudomonas aeruginosa]
MRFNNSVISFPNRGEWGKSNYRGNCSGHVIKGFWETYHKRKDGLACDPSIGGGTSVDVARDLGLRFKGTDLHQGFNLLIDDFKNFLGEEAHTCFWHPPYLDMIHYSGNMWGEADKWDMSRMKMGEFVESLELALLNIHASVERGGVYGI